MDPAKYLSEEFGRPHRRPGDKWAFWYFQPKFLPRQLILDPDTIYAISEADSALGHLQGLGRLIKDPQLLVGPYMTREALASSRIEGTEASLSDVLQAEISGQEQLQDDNIAEVNRYLNAARQGLRLLDHLPISQRLVKEVHSTLMQGVRGQEKLPGEFRRSPVWVGSATDNPETATFVPPLPEEIPDLFSDWERFVNERSRLPVLVRCALMHYQFETIHPFLDGNGRIGRLLIGLMLTQEKRLTSPLLYVSGYLENHRRQYYDHLQAVRETGEIQTFLQFFFTAVSRSAEDAVTRAGRLVELRERYMRQIKDARSRIWMVVDLLFSNPFLTVSRVQNALKLTNQGARNIIREAEALGWVHAIALRGRGGRHYWVAEEIFDIIEAPVSYLSSDVP